MPGRVFFVVPRVSYACGGVNITIQFADILRRSGVDAYLIVERADYRYEFVSYDVPTVYCPIGPAALRLGKRDRMLKALNWRPPGKARNPRVQPGPDDIIVIPEVQYPAQRARFAGCPWILMNQSTTIMAETCARTGYGDLAADPTHIGTIATSEAALRTVRALADPEAVLVPLALDGDRYGHVERKRKLISYMPRRRADQVRIIVDLLRAHPALEGYEFQPIHGMTGAEVDACLRKSLLFLSFSHQEGFGLPPAEAMAMGCLTIGYAGVGGQEFFTKATGFPIPEDDIAEYVTRVVEVVTAYERDPAPLDALRRGASQAILGRYTRAATQEALLNFWNRLEFRTNPA